MSRSISTLFAMSLLGLATTVSSGAFGASLRVNSDCIAPQCDGDSKKGSVAPQCDGDSKKGSVAPQCDGDSKKGSVAPQCDGDTKK